MLALNVATVARLCRLYAVRVRMRALPRTPNPSPNPNQVARLCRLYAADFARRGRGALLLTSSLVALAPLPHAALYGASRAFVRSLLPFALSPKPYALHPTPYALRPTPYALCPKPKAQRSKPKAQSPKPKAQSNSGQVRSLSLGLREECAPSGVAVACLLPGATATEFARVGGTEAAMVFNLPLGIGRRLGVVPPYQYPTSPNTLDPDP